ncbi:non-reducing end alpha-L-arabinofuranosidase family hydrolase [Streptomyces sp. NPDC005402]|uniref:non-reducing end alpha-L-arabinofuranosidase family hydrolase n=1 Tax=Streptomyces sp. NPDC005402 TaxID=3155338 RepID=UPI00339EB4DC
MVHRTGPPSYSTTKDPVDPGSWSRESKRPSFRLDFWTICVRSDRYLFFSDDCSPQYRSRTTRAGFPNGFRGTKIVLGEPHRFDLFEACNVHPVAGTRKYLMPVEAWATGSDWRRSSRAWTPNALIRSNSVTFPDGRAVRTEDFSHGETIRDGVGQTLTIDPCRLRCLYQGPDLAASGHDSRLPWKLSLSTQTNSSCRSLRKKGARTCPPPPGDR